MTVLLWSLPALPVVLGAVLALAGRVADRIAPATAVAVAAVTLPLAVLLAVARPRASAVLFGTLRAGLAVDGLSAVMVVTVAAVALAVLVFAAGDVSRDEDRGRFFGFMLMFTGAMLATVTATDLVLLLMAWELMGAMSYALIGFWWRDGDRVRSATTAFVTTRAGDLGLYFAAGCALVATGSTDLAGLAAGSSPWRDLAAAGIVAACLGKSAQLPFSFWLSRAMAGPSAVSALLHSATMVAAGAYLLLRAEPLLAATGWAATAVAWAGALTALLLGAVALAQRDLKQLLAASTCAQIGFMVLAAGVGARAGGTAHLVAHAAVKSLLFCCAGAWLTALGTKSLTGLHGAARRYPLVGVTFAAGALTLAGLPPMSLWITKDAVLTLAAQRSAALHLVASAAALLATAYAVKALVAVVRRSDTRVDERVGARVDERVGAGVDGQAGERVDDDAERTGTRHVAVLARLPLPALALMAVASGLVGLPTIFAFWRRLVGGAGEPGPAAGELVVSALAAVAVASAVPVLARRGLRAPRLLRSWLCLEQGVILLVWRPLMACARALARFDDHVVDGAVRGVASAAPAARALARFDDGLIDGVVRGVPRAGTALATLVTRRFEGGVDGIVRGVATGVTRLGSLARRPQTGLPHHYLAQAVAGFVLLALIVVLTR
ncbi:NADH-quinone oxidoreductase subunit L [Microbispora cellulosiformans]|uniref:NADH-quinone oxidoreductase subunit L n=1 Tax=Microbispora cellulosiformans TaxID=2614688 RepID=A0A5J5JW00_9ACTN|nr:proton-conducting transporter membrane subunit [Microbispora cellulosiformans]KAA9375502.1 NADH-quinone oxidoreductase subunit L [Microbispora cellulosiformans]